MHRIDSPGALNGFFSAGNPAAGQMATLHSPDWLNDIQENIAKVIEDQGIGLVKGDYAQLSNAIVALVAGAVGDGSGEVPTTRQVLGGGLVTGGGNLGVDRTLTVTKATTAEVAAGIRDDVAVTPYSLVGGLGSRLLEGTGYATMLGGLILQWTPITVNGNGSTTIALPIAFPSQCVHASFEGGALGTNAQDNNPFVSYRSALNVTVFSAVDNSVSGTLWALGF